MDTWDTFFNPLVFGGSRPEGLHCYSDTSGVGAVCVSVSRNMTYVPKLPIQMAQKIEVGESTPLKFNSELTPEKRWLEDDPFLLGFGNFSVAMLNFGGVDFEKI